MLLAQQVPEEITEVLSDPVKVLVLVTVVVLCALVFVTWRYRVWWTRFKDATRLLEQALAEIQRLSNITSTHSLVPTSLLSSFQGRVDRQTLREADEATGYELIGGDKASRGPSDDDFDGPTGSR